MGSSYFKHTYQHSAEKLLITFFWGKSAFRHHIQPRHCSSIKTNSIRTTKNRHLPDPRKKRDMDTNPCLFLAVYA